LHAEISAKKFGGVSSDYQKIHDWFDQTKAHFPDMRHRAILHSSFGIYLCEQVFGTFFDRESDGKRVQVRDVGEQHVIDDMGRIPTLQDYLSELPFYSWLGGREKKKVKMRVEDLTFDTPPSTPLPGTQIVD
jgi:hypothetical protein